MIFQKIRRGSSRRAAFVAGLLVAAVSMTGLVGAGVASAASNCAAKNDSDNNAIIYCGFSSPSAFINKVKSNNSGNGHSDLKNVYAYYGLEPADYDRFVSSSRQGSVYSDGRIVVDGQTVATGAKSIGRIASYHGSGYFTTKINGVSYYGNVTSKTFAKGVTSLPATILFNSKGAVQFAVINSCGNPTYGNNVTPSYSCNALHKTAVAGKSNTYQFTTSASAANNATVAKVVYSFGDGTSATEASPSTPVTHTYTTAGTYTAKVTVYVHLPGNQQVTVTSSTCQTVIAVPFYQCLQLTGAILDQSKMSYSFTATAKYGGGATFTSADFNFGDGNTQEGVKPAAGASSVTVQHMYAKAGNYNASAVLHFNASGQSVSAPACAALVTPTTPPTPECKPGVPVGSADCNQCQSDSSLPADSPQCTTTPTALPNTGAGDTIAIFAGVAAAGFLVYRQLLFRKHKAAFAAAQMGTSPLPLGDPMNASDPLRDTPLGEKKAVRSTFRRKRPF